MISVLNNFDPLELLDASQTQYLDENSKRKISSIVLSKFWDYLIINLSEDLDENQLEGVLDTVTKEQRYMVLKKIVSSLDQKIAKCLEEFKKDF